MRLTIVSVILISLIFAVPAAAQYRPEYLLWKADTLIARSTAGNSSADSLIAIADSLKTLLSTATDSYGMMTSTGRVTVVINESADDIAYGTPKYYAVPMAGYSRCTLKCVFAGATTTSIINLSCLLSETSDITLATGNPVWFDPTPQDSTITPWIFHSVGATTANMGKAVPVMDIYGAWATADYIIVKVTATTNTANDIQDFKLIAIKEQ